MGVGGGHTVDLAGGGEVWEHRARFTGLNVEGELFEHLLGLHILEGSAELVCIEVIAIRWEAEQVGASVVGVEDEDVGVSVGLKDLSASGGSVSGENS